MQGVYFKDLQVIANINGLLGTAEGAVPTPGYNGYKFTYSSDGTLISNSDAIIPTQKAIKTYVDNMTSGGGSQLLWDGTVPFSTFYTGNNIASATNAITVTLKGTGHNIDNKGSIYTNIKCVSFNSLDDVRTINIKQDATLDYLPTLLNKVALQSQSTSYVIVNTSIAQIVFIGRTCSLQCDSSVSGAKFISLTGSNSMVLSLFNGNIINSHVFDLINTATLQLAFYDNCSLDTTSVSGTATTTLVLIYLNNLDVFAIPYRSTFTNFSGNIVYIPISDNNQLRNVPQVTWDGSVLFSDFYSFQNISALTGPLIITLVGTGHTIDNFGSAYTNLQNVYLYTGTIIKTVNISTGVTFDSLPNLSTGINLVSQSTSVISTNPTNTNFWYIGLNSSFSTDSSISGSKGISLTAGTFNILLDNGSIATTGSLYNNTIHIATLATVVITVINSTGIQSIEPKVFYGTNGTLTVKSAGGAFSFPLAAAYTNYTGTLYNDYIGITDNSKNWIHTGLISGGAITINVGASNKIDVAAGSGVIVNLTNDTAPEIFPVSWPTKTALLTPYLATQVTSWVGYSFSAVNIIFSATDFTPEQLHNDVVRLGKIYHINNTTVSAVEALPLLFYSDLDSQLFNTSIGVINLQGNTITANGANLNLDLSSGLCWRTGANIGDDANNPNFLTIYSSSAFNFFPAYQSSTTGLSTVLSTGTSLDPSQYDDGSGSLAPVTAGYYTIQTALFFPVGTDFQMFVLYGQAQYATYDDAIAALALYSPVIQQDLAGGNIRAFIVIAKGTTDLDAAIAGGTAYISNGFMFGTQGGGGGGGSGGEGQEIGGGDAIYYVSKVGADTNTGMTMNHPMLTIGAAYTLAQAVGTSSRAATIRVIDSGIYSETITIEVGKYVNLELGESILTSTGTTLTLSGRSLVTGFEVETTSSNITDNAILIDTTGGGSIVDVQLILSTATNSYALNSIGIAGPHVYAAYISSATIGSGALKMDANEVAILNFNAGTFSGKINTLKKITTTNSSYAGTIYLDFNICETSIVLQGSTGASATLQGNYCPSITAALPLIQGRINNTGSYTVSGIGTVSYLSLPQMTAGTITITSPAVAYLDAETINTASSITGTYIRWDGATKATTGGTLALRDAAANLYANNFVPNVNTTDIPLEGATVSLTNTSKQIQLFTGVGSAIVNLPNATSISTGLTYTFNNKSLGVVNIYNYTAGTVLVLWPGCTDRITCTGNGNSTGVWLVEGMSPTGYNTNGTVFYFDRTTIIASSGQTAYPVRSLKTTPNPLSKAWIDSCTVTNSLAPIAFYWYNNALFNLSFPAGNWQLQLYAFISAMTANTLDSYLMFSFFDVQPIAGNITISGTGTSRIATASSGAFLNSDANAIVNLASYILTPSACLQITGYTSANVVTVKTLNTYVNEITVAWYKGLNIFQATSYQITDLTVPAKANYLPIYNISNYSTGITDSLMIMVCGQTNSTDATTISLEMNNAVAGTSIATPLQTPHNLLGGIQGGSSGLYYHVVLNEWNAIHYANGPSRTNVMATMNDISGLSSNYRANATFYSPASPGAVQINIRANKVFNQIFLSIDSIQLGGGTAVPGYIYGDSAIPSGWCPTSGQTIQLPIVTFSTSPEVYIINIGRFQMDSSGNITIYFEPGNIAFPVVPADYMFGTMLLNATFMQV